MAHRRLGTPSSRTNRDANGAGQAAAGALPGYAIRRHRPGDEQRVLALLRATVGQTAASRKTEEFWHWKHGASPFGPSYSILAWDDETGELAGLRTLMRWSFRDRAGATYDAARAVDTATHPGHQRKGIFSGLTRAAIQDLTREGAAFIFNTPNEQSLPANLKMGWAEVSRWPIYVRPTSWIGLGPRLLRSSGGGDTGAEREREERMPGWNEFLAGWEKELMALVDRHEGARASVGYRTERTPAFLRWRYGGHPEVKYVVHADRAEGGALAGAVIGRRVRGAGGLSAFLIAELFMADPTVREAARVLETLRGRTTADYLAAHFAPGTVERRGLKRAGFFRAPRRGYTFAALPLSSDAPDPTHPGAWDLTLSELEIF